MARIPTGNAYEKNGVWFARVSHPDGRRVRYVLGKGHSEARARDMAAALSERVRDGKHVHLGKTRDERAAAPVTVEQFGEAWTSGALFEKHGAVNGLRIKKSADVDAYRLRAHLYKPLGRKAVADVTEIDIERVMAASPKAWEPATRKLLYSALHRLFDLAIMPGRLRITNPVSRYLRPGKGAPKLFSYLYPAELLAVLGCIAVPLGRRVVYALAVYTGLRRGSLFALRWSGVDLENGTLLSTVSKTGIAQMFEIAPGLVSVLRAWHVYCGKPGPDKRIARDVKVDQHRLAPALRDDLRAAGVTRPVLFQVDAKNIEPLRFHDLRATFVTWAKRAGLGDGWISDRTGHVTPAMIDRYSRAARTLADLRIEPFPDLTNAIPELATKRPSAELGEPNGGEALPEIAPNAAEYEQIRPLVVPGVAGSSPVTHPGFLKIDPRSVAFSVANSAGEARVGPSTASPRSGLVRALAEAVAEATASGDSKAARVALAALGQLVGDDGAGAGDCGVIDLAAERRKRGDG